MKGVQGRQRNRNPSLSHNTSAVVLCFSLSSISTTLLMFAVNIGKPFHPSAPVFVLINTLGHTHTHIHTHIQNHKPSNKGKSSDIFQLHRGLMINYLIRNYYRFCTSFWFTKIKVSPTALNELPLHHLVKQPDFSVSEAQWMVLNKICCFPLNLQFAAASTWAQ